MKAFRLNDHFMLGTATASAQIEGGDRNNTWYQWCENGHIADSTSCYTACDHWNRLEQDTALLKKLNVQTHRMSLEWSRIEPIKGKFSKEAISHYRYELQLLTDSGIQPLVTLHHFSEPLWFIEAGGWAKPGNSELFLSFARYAVEHLGDLVSDWITFNEPNVYTPFGYMIGCFPPGHRDLREARKVASELIRTHVELYRMIHRIREERRFKGKTRVGAALHIRVFEGITPLGKITARIADYVFNSLFLEGMTEGHIRLPLCKSKQPARKICADFLGINYYTRNVVEFALDPSQYFHRFIPDSRLDKTDVGWDIYPEGIYQVCREYYRKYHLPIYITENGISDHLDSRRPNFIIDHLSYVAKAMNEGIPIERYYYWTLMDNFEWLNGEHGFFGLYHCNFRTQERFPRGSASLYAQICKNKGVSEEMLRDFYSREQINVKKPSAAQ